MGNINPKDEGEKKGWDVFLKIFFSRIAGQNAVKFCTKHSYEKEKVNHENQTLIHL